MIGALSELVGRIRVHQATINALGIEHLDIFGSWARGRARDGSDVDVIAIFASDRRSSYFQLARLQLLLESELRTRVDVVSHAGVSAHGRDLGETVRVF